MTNDDYIKRNVCEDVRSLALRGAPEGVDLTWCLQQIEGRQLAEKKLPHWAAIEGLHYPPRLSLEQCSSQATATYKQQLVQRLLPRIESFRELSKVFENTRPAEAPVLGSSFADLTGGLGVDFAALAPLFQRAVYVERQPHLCQLARHNFPLLGLPHAEVIEGDGAKLLSESSGFSAASSDFLPPSPAGEGRGGVLRGGVLFLDPARRDGAGRKTVALPDCTPDVTRLLPSLLARCRLLLLKLSPMLDIALALRQLTAALGPGASCPVREVHAVSVQGECKELLLVLDSSESSEIAYIAADLPPSLSIESLREPSKVFESLRFSAADLRATPSIASSDSLSPSPAGEGWGGVSFLYEPSPSILKLGAQDALCHRLGVQKLHAMSHLFTSPELVPDFPGRTFRILSVGDFSKQSLRRLLSGLTQANLTVRNFPQSVADLRKRLRLREGGDTYLFATTLADGRHALLLCTKA